MDTNKIGDYWDLTNRERSELTREDLDRFITYELMKAGVLRVQEPELEPVPVVEPVTRPYHVVTFDRYGPAVVFETSEQALAFVALKPRCKDRDWTTDSSFVASGEPTVTIESLMDEAEKTRLARALTERKKIEESNAKKRENYSAAQKAEREALGDLLTDWEDQKANAARAKRIGDTFEEYATLCKGDREVALTFLRKAFAEDEIEEAFEWLEIKLPSEVPAVP